MAANNDPIFSRIGDVTFNGTTGMGQAILSGANDFTGAGVNNVLVFTADAANGGFIQRLRFKAAGSNAATVARIFINNGAVNTTATNNSFYGEVGLPTTTTLSAQPSSPDIDYFMNLALPAGFKLYVGLGLSVSAGWFAVPVAGKY